MSKNDKVRKNVKNASKIWFPNGTKNNNTSSHILLDHSDAFSFSFYAALLEKKFLKGGYPSGPIWPRPFFAPGWIQPKNNNTCRAPWVLQPCQVSLKSLQWFRNRNHKCEKTPPPHFLKLKKFIKISKIEFQ